MKSRTSLYGLVLVSLTLSTISTAGNDRRAARMTAQLDSRFAAADINHDGQLTAAEAKEKMPRVYSHFHQIDTTRKGFVTLEEVKAFGVAELAQRQR